MLTQIYLEALLVDKNLADQVLALLESGQIDADTAITGLNEIFKLKQKKSNLTQPSVVTG